MYIKTTTICLLLSFSFLCNATKNIEFLREETKKKDFSANIEARIDGETGNKSENNLETNLGVAWLEGSSHVMILGSHKWQNNRDEITHNESLLHIRYTKHFGELKNKGIEFFAQAQRDSFLQLESRALIGIGWRGTLTNTEKKRFNALGIGAMYESERPNDITDINKESDTSRANIYWHHKQDIKNDTAIENVIYLQPDIGRLSDIRIMNEARVNHKITANLQAGFTIKYFYDSQPFEGTKKEDILYGTYISYTF